MISSVVRRPSLIYITIRMQEASPNSTIVNSVVCEGPIYYKHKSSWREKYAELIKYTKEEEGCVHVLKICDKKGSKPIKEIKSQHITGIEIHSEDISDENKLTFKVLSSDMKKPLCLYSKTHEEISNWVASLLVTISKGKLYHVKHYSDDSISMQHSILYLTNAYDEDTDKNEFSLVLSSPLDGSRVRKSWKVSVIKEVVQLNAAIKLVLCPTCYKSITEQVSMEFILFVPSNNATECIEFICQNPCFVLASSDERIISYNNTEHDKICSQENQNNEDSIATNTFSGSSNDLHNNLTDTESDNVKDSHKLHQPEDQNTTAQTMGTPHESLVTETCDSPEEDTSTTRSGSSEIKVSGRPKIHIYEQIPFSTDTSRGACQADDQSPATQTPGTLHRSLVKPVGKDASTIQNNSKMLLPPRGFHFYEEIPHKTRENPDKKGNNDKASEDRKDLEVHHETPHTKCANDDSDEQAIPIIPCAVVGLESKPTMDKDISESTQKPSVKTNNADADETLTSETYQSTSTEHQSTPIPLPRRKKTNACTMPELNQNSEDEKKSGMCKTELKEMSMRPTPKPRKNVPNFPHIQDTITELNEVDNCDEDQSNTRSDSIPEDKLKPVPKPRVGGRLSSYTDEENYTRLIPFLMDDSQQNNGGYLIPNLVVTVGSENNEKSHKMN